MLEMKMKMRYIDTWYQLLALHFDPNREGRWEEDEGHQGEVLTW